VSAGAQSLDDRFLVGKVRFAKLTERSSEGVIGHLSPQDSREQQNGKQQCDQLRSAVPRPFYL
jgi:hypothetical protein